MSIDSIFNNRIEWLIDVICSPWSISTLRQGVNHKLVRVDEDDRLMCISNRLTHWQPCGLYAPWSWSGRKCFLVYHFFIRNPWAGGNCDCAVPSVCYSQSCLIRPKICLIFVMNLKGWLRGAFIIGWHWGVLGDSNKLSGNCSLKEVELSVAWIWNIWWKMKVNFSLRVFGKTCVSDTTH